VDPVAALGATLPRRLVLCLIKCQSERLGDMAAVRTWLLSEPGIAVVSVLKWLWESGTIGPDPVIDGSGRTNETDSVYVVISPHEKEWHYVSVRPGAKGADGSLPVYVDRFTLSDEHGTSQGPADHPAHTELAYRGDHLARILAMPGRHQ
jgi:hypothetical protein